MADSREDILSEIDLPRCCIRNFKGFIFLCGGHVPKELVERHSKPYHSLRHHLIHKIETENVDLDGKIIQAELFGEWLEFGRYNDHITFQRHLAGLAVVVPIVLESSGSIAEFGAFSQQKSLRISHTNLH